MSKFLLAATAALLLSATAANAHDACYPAVTGKSKYKQDTMRAAYHEAILAWDSAAEDKYDDDFDWYYSADRTIACKWKSGRDILCTATARPCTR